MLHRWLCQDAEAAVVGELTASEVSPFHIRTSNEIPVELCLSDPGSSQWNCINKIIYFLLYLFDTKKFILFQAK